MTVGADQQGARLDRALTALTSDWTRSRIKKWIDEGRVLRNGAAARQSERVNEGDVLELEVPDIVPLDAEPEDIPLSILFEDEHLLILDKSAGLVIHPAAGNPAGTLVNALLHHCKDLSGIGGVERPGIVHRLDKDTTGAMVVAKNDRAHLGLSLAFGRREIEKTYLAVCYGTPRDSEGVIEAPIDRHPTDRKKMAVREGGHKARTLYRVMERYEGASLLACTLITGRTHQIRVHCAHIGHAVIGDPTYSGRQWRNLIDEMARNACRDFPRQALHSRSLAFTHPVTAELVSVEAPIPDDMAGLIEALRG
ncbi:MAG: RluA family pseudouridine synthase [Acidobacteria bacterium]|nr:RluA family pseudouridine synthase [Acidobacteriota bacterium]